MLKQNVFELVKIALLKLKTIWKQKLIIIGKQISEQFSCLAWEKKYRSSWIKCLPLSLIFHYFTTLKFEDQTFTITDLLTFYLPQI